MLIGEDELMNDPDLLRDATMGRTVREEPDEVDTLKMDEIEVKS